MRRARLLGLGTGAAALVAVIAALWPVPVLTVTAVPPARVLLRTPLRGAVEVRLDYIHSVERTPVVETYRADPRGLRLVRMEFAAQGAGLPSVGFVREGSRFVLRTDRPLAELAVRVSAVGRQRLRVGGAAFDLLAVTEGGTVTVAVRSAPRLPLLRGMLY